MNSILSSLSSSIRNALAILLTVLVSALAMPASADTVTYYHNDLLGTPIAASDATGKVIWRRAYDPFGAQVASTASTSNVRIDYTGHTKDAETGLVNMGARMYNPEIGMFYGLDQAAIDPHNEFSFNRYAYANQNPYRYVDPDGNSPLEWVFVGGDVASFAMNVAAGNWGGAGFDAFNIVLDLQPIPGLSEASHAIKAAEAAVKTEKVASEVAKGGTYVLKNAEGTVVKTGRTKDLARREAEHGRKHPDTTFQVDKRTDDYAAQRGREQDLHDAHPTAHKDNGGLDRINGISPTNPRREEYLKAGRKLP